MFAIKYYLAVNLNCNLCVRGAVDKLFSWKSLSIYREFLFKRQKNILLNLLWRRQGSGFRSWSKVVSSLCPPSSTQIWFLHCGYFCSIGSSVLISCFSLILYLMMLCCFSHLSDSKSKSHRQRSHRLKLYLRAWCIWNIIWLSNRIPGFLSTTKLDAH